MLEAENNATKHKIMSLGLFEEDETTSYENFTRDPITNEIIPSPLKPDYPIVNYWEVQQYEQFVG